MHVVFAFKALTSCTGLGTKSARDTLSPPTPTLVPREDPCALEGFVFLPMLMHHADFRGGQLRNQWEEGLV